MVRSPIALSVFNRPESTERVMETIRAARPKQLFVFADGPRTDEEAGLCTQARTLVENVDWDCEAKYDYSQSNLGARRRYASGVDWVFSHVEDAIVLDDDCVADPTFFTFCDQMLEQYRDDPRIMMVCGTNYLGQWKSDRQSYHFSYFGAVWGWATWRRAWKLYDGSMDAWGDEEVREGIRALLEDEELYALQARRFDRLYHETQDRHSWDLPWSLTRLAHGGLTVMPSVNLVQNLGNTDGRGLPPEHPLANLAVGSLAFPLRPPRALRVDREYDRLHMRRIFEWWEQGAPGAHVARRPFYRRVFGRPRKALRRLVRRTGR